jgi:hypothetical protein
MHFAKISIFVGISMLWILSVVVVVHCVAAAAWVGLAIRAQGRATLSSNVPSDGNALLHGAAE